MDNIKKTKKHKPVKVWALVSSITMVLVFTLTMVMTQVPIISGTFNIIFGRAQAIIGDNKGLYTVSEGITDKESAYDAANELNIEIASEGTILLKNDQNVLPFAPNSKISVFGKNSVNLLYGGSGSGGYSNSEMKTIYDSLEAAGFSYNTTLRSFYENTSQSGNARIASPGFDEIIAGFPTAETPVENYIKYNIPDSYNDHDTALIVLTRIGGEGFDLPRTMKSASATDNSLKSLESEEAWNDDVNFAVKGARNKDDHYLELDKNEAELIQHVTDNFDKVVIVLNTNNNLELGFLDDPSYWTDTLGMPDQSSKIQGALWIGTPGGYGIMSLGKILNGTVNPSGRTVSIHARDFTKDPTYNNFGNNNEYEGDAYLLANGNLPSAPARQYFVEYEEGIYVGYRYYETRGFTDGQEWYDNNVVYPTGFGLSYSEFDWTIGDMKLDGKVIDDNYKLSQSDANKSISVDVTVTNKESSSKAGKDVVQLYVSAPYTTDGIEKTHVQLAAFAKTKLLDPGESQTVTLEFSLYDIASYDYNDDNSNGFKGWETEAGDYKVYVSRNSHSWADISPMSYSFTVPQSQPNASKGNTGFTYDKDPVTKEDIENRFDDVSYGRDNRTSDMIYLSRGDWENTWPTAPTVESRSNTQEWMNALTWRMAENDVEGKPWYKTEDQMPNQATSPVAKEDAIQLMDLVGVDYNDPLWEKFLDQLTVGQMTELVGIGAFGTIPLENVGVPLTVGSDGPVGWVNFMSDNLVYGTAFYASQSVLGATYNTQLAYEYGVMIGDEALIGDSEGDGLPYTGWYAPGANIHRSPFSGRNWEYYSEDPLLTGKMAANIIKGAKSKGVILFAKHFALNDQETNRGGVLTWANEQAMREIFLKSFEILVKEGPANGLMSSYNRIGATWTGGDYRLLTELLRGEWGFNGVIVTDYATGRHQNPNQMVRAGGDLNFYQTSGALSSDANNATQVCALRAASKNVLYAITNSNAMNYEILGYHLPVWMTALIWINVGLFIAFAAWGGVLLFLSFRKSKPNNEITNEKLDN